MMRRVVLALCALALAGVQTHAQFLPGRPPGFRPGFQFLGLSSPNGFPTSGSLADYDWANNRFSGPPINVSRASLASVAGPDGLITQADPNTPRVEYEPKAGAPRKNWIANSSAYNLTAGTLGSGGGLPTGWSTFSTATGVSAAVSAATVNGVDGFSIRVFGTPTANGNFQLLPLSNAAMSPAQVNQPWTHAQTLALTAGATTNFVVSLLVEEWTNGIAYTAGNGAVIGTIPATPSRFAHTRTLTSPTAAYAKPVINFAVTSGQAVDGTFFIAQSQFEQSAVPTAWIKTTTQAAEAGGRTNYLRNSTWQGIQAGAVLLNGGLIPGSTSIYTGVPAGVTATVLGVEKRGDLDVLRIQVTGTATANQSLVLQFDSSNSNILGSQGQVWTSSFYASGSGTLPQASTALTEYLAGSGNPFASSGGLSAFTLPSTLTRYSYTRTLLTPGTASISNNFSLPFTAGQAANGVLELAAPQLEQASAPTPVIKTYGFPVSADSPRTNAIRNAAAIGAVPGLLGSGGAAPLYWTISNGALGITGQVVGSDPAGEFLDVRWSGTTTGTDWSTSNAPLNFESTTAVSAAFGQTWTVSAGVEVIGGALPAGFVVQLDPCERSSNGGLATGHAIPITPGAARSGVTATFTNASVAFVQPMLRMGFSSPAAGRDVDFTLRIRKPQLEQRGAASDSILTQGAALTTDVERRNLVRNSAQTGLTIGSTAVPSTWAGGGNPNGGITRTVVGQGTTSDGLPYTDYRWQGTSTATGANLIANILFDQGGIPAGPGQITVTNSVSMALIAGTLPVASGNAPPSLVIERTATTGAWTTQAMALTGALTRFSVTATPTDAGLTMVRPSFWVYGPATPGTAVDFTLRIAVPQFELSPYATPPIVTTNGAVTVGPGSAYSRGLLIEGSQTNYIANNAMVGATVGGVGTAGNPTGWVGNLNGPGIAQTVVGASQQRGLDCIDLRVNGTATGTIASVLFFGPQLNQISASPGQLHTLSAYTALIGGSFANVAGLDLAIREGDNGTGFLRQTLGSVMNPVSFSRTAVNATMGASTAGVSTGIRLAAVSGAVIDFTLRLCSPQAEVWSSSVTTVGGASSVIRTTGTAATRAADVVTATLASGLGNANAVAVVGQTAPFPVSQATILRIGTAADGVFLRRNGSGQQLLVQPIVASTPQTAAAITGTLADGARFAAAATVAPADEAISVNGSTVVTAAPSSVPSGMTTILLGAGAANPWFGYLERFTLKPYRPANSNIQTDATLQASGG